MVFTWRTNACNAQSPAVCPRVSFRSLKLSMSIMTMQSG